MSHSRVYSRQNHILQLFIRLFLIWVSDIHIQSNRQFRYQTDNLPKKMKISTQIYYSFLQWISLFWILTLIFTQIFSKISKYAIFLQIVSQDQSSCVRIIDAFRSFCSAMVSITVVMVAMKMNDVPLMNVRKIHQKIII